VGICLAVITAAYLTLGLVGRVGVWVAMGRRKDLCSLPGPPRLWPCSRSLWSRCSSARSPGWRHV